MFSKQLKYLRQSKGLNQVQLAEKLGVKKQSISNWENDNILPSIEMLEKTANFFHVSVDYLLGRIKENNFDGVFIEATGLDENEIKHIKFIIDDIRNNKK